MGEAALDRTPDPPVTGKPDVLLPRPVVPRAALAGPRRPALRSWFDYGPADGIHGFLPAAHTAIGWAF